MRYRCGKASAAPKRSSTHNACTPVHRHPQAPKHSERTCNVLGGGGLDVRVDLAEGGHALGPHVLEDLLGERVPPADTVVNQQMGNKRALTCKGLEDLLGERVPPARGLLVKMGQNVVLNRTNWKISVVGGSHLRKRFGASQEVGRSTLWQTRRRKQHRAEQHLLVKRVRGHALLTFCSLWLRWPLPPLPA